MIYKFKYKPNYKVPSKTTGREVFTFNRKGEYITDDPDIIERAKPHFDHLMLDVDFEKPLPVKEEATEEVDEEAIRAEAKAAGIKSWHNKKIETILEELDK